MKTTNNVVLVGRLTKDPFRSETENAPCFCTIACDAGYKDKEGKRVADFVEFKAWRAVADVLKKYCHKGDLLAVGGYAATEKDKDGKGNLVIVADSVQILASPKGNAKASTPEAPVKAENSEVEVNVEEDELPYY